MMQVPAHLRVQPPLGVRACTFVWDAWRALDARFLRTALAFAVTMGTLLGGSAFLLPRQPTYRNFMSEFMDTLVMTVALVLCLAVAARVRPQRVPRWVPYIIAAGAAFLLDTLFSAFVKEPALAAIVADQKQWPGYTAPLLTNIWIHWPRSLIFCSLASIGFMFAHEARLRADALRRVQFDRATLARRAFESRLQAMQARVEPQFLFDTLAHIEKLYESDADAAEGMLDDLIVFLRKALPSLEETASTVDAEFALARAWLGIAKGRLGARLQFAIASPEGAERIRMPPMILLPLLERAVETMTPSGLPKVIEISAHVVGDCLRISLIETQPGASDRRTETLSQIQERLHSLYGERTSIETHDDDATWRTTMEIPHERSDRDHR